MAFTPRRIHGEGPQSCSLMIVGSQPGWNEERAGRVFVGKTGEELDRFLDGKALPARRDVFLTNLYREYRGKNYFYTKGDLARDEPDLIAELKRVQPKTIVPLGREATRWFLGDVDMEDVESIPWYAPNDVVRLEDVPPLIAPDARVIFPITHIAAAFHNPEKAAYVVSGFRQLVAYLAGSIQPRILFDDPYPEPHYEEIRTQEALTAALGRLVQGASLAIDTEGWPARPWSLQFSFEPGTGYCICAACPSLLARFGEYIHHHRVRLCFHSALHDVGVGRELGCDVTDLQFDDTMIMAYLLQLEPQGLKALCSRHAGMKMQSYEDVLGDADQRLALDYVSGLWSIEQYEYENRCKDAFWTAIDAGKRCRVFPKLPKTALHRSVERCLRSLDARKLWHKQVEDTQVEGYCRLGPMPEPTLDHVPRAAAMRYACRDADGPGRVLPTLLARIDAMGLREIYDLELAVVPLIERMSYVGIKPDLQHFRVLSSRLGNELQMLQAALHRQTSLDGFNANSGDQVGDYLFDTLGLDSIKDTRSGRGSTNDKILEALEHEHPEFPVITLIRDYREVFKLKHTFVDRLPDFVRRWPFDGRIHATFRTTRVVTGRLAASNPNLLAMPKHGKFAREFRRGWVPEAGHILCEWDLSQIELRVLAHLSQDTVLLAAFRDGYDLHARLAQRIFGGTESDHKKGTTRLAAKAVNFGIPMGMTCKGLSVELRKNGVDADEDDAQKWLDETLALYERVPLYQERMANEARNQGFVRCLSGRIRYIGGIDASQPSVREEARRFAFSTPIQEGAQWIMKQAEARVWAMLQEYWKAGRWVEPLIQIHDSLTLECEDDPMLAQDLNAQMVRIMTTAPKGFTVPIEVSGDWGHNWCAYDEKAPYSPSIPRNGDMVAF